MTDKETPEPSTVAEPEPTDPGAPVMQAIGESDPGFPTMEAIAGSAGDPGEPEMVVSRLSRRDPEDEG